MLYILFWPIRLGYLINITRTNGAHTAPFFVKFLFVCWNGDHIYLEKRVSSVVAVVKNDSVWKALGATPLRWTEGARSQSPSIPLQGRAGLTGKEQWRHSIFTHWVLVFFFSSSLISHLSLLSIFFLPVFLRRPTSTGTSNSKCLLCISVFIEEPDRDWPKATHRICRMPA